MSIQRCPIDKKNSDRPIPENKERLITSGISHSFNHDIAVKCGLEAAVLYNYMTINGPILTDDSYEDVTRYMPYLTISKIEFSIEQLVEAGLIKKSSNKVPFIGEKK